MVSCCSFEDRIAMFKCVGKRFRAETAMSYFYDDNSSEDKIQKMNDRCGDFESCTGTLEKCSPVGFIITKTMCRAAIARGHFMRCSNKLTGNAEQTQEQFLTDEFKSCVEIGKHQNKSECTLFQECTEKLIIDHCDPSVLPWTKDIYGNMFSDIPECKKEEEDGSGSLFI